MLILKWETKYIYAQTSKHIYKFLMVLHKINIKDLYYNIHIHIQQWLCFLYIPSVEFGGKLTSALEIKKIKC